MDNSTGWMPAVQSDLAFMHACNSEGTAFTSVSEFISTTKQGGANKLANAVRRTVCTPFANLDMPKTGSSSANISVPNISIQFCPYCSIDKLDTVQKLKVHLWSKHRVKDDPLRLRIPPSTVCCVCMLDFHSRPRLLNHIRYRSKVCRAYHNVCEPCLTVDQAEELDNLSREHNRNLYAKGYRRHQATIRAFRTPGPLLFCPGATKHHSLGVGRQYFNN